MSGTVVARKGCYENAGADRANAFTTRFQQSIHLGMNSTAEFQQLSDPTSSKLLYDSFFAQIVFQKIFDVVVQIISYLNLEGIRLSSGSTPLPIPCHH